MNIQGILAVLTLLALMLPANSLAQALAQKPLSVFVSILPQQYFVQRIAGEKAQVQVLVKPGKSPETYSPSPHQIKALASSDLYFRVGIPFEKGLLPKIASVSQGLRIVDTLQGIEFRDMDPAESTGHDDHDHMGKDPHTWMNPLLVKIQARNMAEALIKLDPENKDLYEQNMTAFARDLEELHQRLKSLLDPFKGETLFVFHPVFGYFTDLYGMRQMAVETMGKTPKGKQLSAIISLAKAEKARVIFVQPQFDRNSAQKIAAAINGAVVSVDPLAFDYLANLEAIAQTIVSSLPPKETP